MSNRFQSANLFWWIIIPGAFIIWFLLSYYPHVIPLSYLGVLGNFLSYLVSNHCRVLIIGFWVTILAHVYEAIVAYRICQKLKIDQQSTFLWTIQTFILGFYSFT
jgi:type IV secretory pathway TrbL component